MTTLANSGLIGWAGASNLATAQLFERTPERLIKEFFGLRKSVIMNDDGTTVRDVINDLKDPIVLKRNGVSYDKYSEKLNSLGITEEIFYSIIPREYVWDTDNASSEVSSEWTKISTRGRKPKVSKD